MVSVKEPIPRTLGLTPEAARIYVGYDCSVEWLEPDGRWAAMDGHVLAIDWDGHLCVDYGYGVPVEEITKITVFGPHEER